MRIETGSLDFAYQLGRWIDRLQAIARTGLAFNPHAYDAERYHELLKLASEMAASLQGHGLLDAEVAEMLYAHWLKVVGSGVAGYITPKVGIGAVVFNQRDELLLIQRADNGKWLFPVGWAEVGYTPAEVATKEVAEETGLRVTPLSLIGVYDSYRHGFAPGIHLYRLVFYCRLDGGELRAAPEEALEVGFFPEDALPQPLYGNPLCVQHAFAWHRGEMRQVYFDG